MSTFRIQCPACRTRRIISHMHWRALCCPGCKLTIHNPLIDPAASRASLFARRVAETSRLATSGPLGGAPGAIVGKEAPQGLGGFVARAALLGLTSPDLYREEMIRDLLITLEIVARALVLTTEEETGHDPRAIEDMINEMIPPIILDGLTPTDPIALTGWLYSRPEPRLAWTDEAARTTGNNPLDPIAARLAQGYRAELEAVLDLIVGEILALAKIDQDKIIALPSKPSQLGPPN